MRKIILQTIIILTILSCSTTKTVESNKVDNQNEKPITYDYADKIDSEKLGFIKKNYNWNNEKVLILNYSQPISSCHFDNNKITSDGKNGGKIFIPK